MGTAKPFIPHELVKELLTHYLHLKQSNHHFVKNSSANNKPTIMIIGTGISGLSAATELTKHGLNVVMIEARDRIGGRIHSLEVNKNTFIELGAQFLHGIKDNILFKVCGDYQIEAKPYSRSEWAIFDIEGKKIDKEQLSDLVWEYKHLLKNLSIERQSDGTDRFTIQDMQALDLKLLHQTGIVSADLHSLAKSISLKEFNQERLFHYKLGVDKKESESNFLITNGLAKLTDGLFKDAQETGLLKLILSTEINKIYHSSDEIIAYAKNGQVFHADAVICTLPLGVLKAGSVIFDPLLPKPKIKAINVLNTAIHNKVILEFEEVFWEDLSHFVVLYDPTFNAWLDIVNLQYFYPEKAPIFVASVHANDEGYELPSDKYIVNHFTNLLKRIYPASFRPLKNHWVTHWDKDPYALGSYSYHPKDSSLDDNSELAKPIGRLIFAGEHTHRSPSNMQGAYLSGLESAKQAVEQLSHIFTSVT